MRCAACTVDLEGTWSRCPLCGSDAVTGDPAPSPLLAAPLLFSRRRVLKALFLASLAMIFASFLVQLVFSRDLPGLGALRSVWLGVASMWLLVLMAVRKRRNLAKGTVYLVTLIGLICAYWDYLTGWHGWSLTWAIPIVCAASIIGLLITVRVMRVEVGEHVLYSALTMALGVVPIIFLVFGWVSESLPSLICVCLSLVALALLLHNRSAEMRGELAKRLNL